MDFNDYANAPPGTRDLPRQPSYAPPYASPPGYAPLPSGYAPSTPGYAPLPSGYAPLRPPPQSAEPGRDTWGRPEPSLERSWQRVVDATPGPDVESPWGAIAIVGGAAIVTTVLVGYLWRGSANGAARQQGATPTEPGTVPLTEVLPLAPPPDRPATPALRSDWGTAQTENCPVTLRGVSRYYAAEEDEREQGTLAQGTRVTVLQVGTRSRSATLRACRVRIESGRLANQEKWVFLGSNEIGQCPARPASGLELQATDAVAAACAARFRSLPTGLQHDLWEAVTGTPLGAQDTGTLEEQLATWLHEADPEVNGGRFVAVVEAAWRTLRPVSAAACVEGGLAGAGCLESPLEPGQGPAPAARLPGGEDDGYTTVEATSALREASGGLPEGFLPMRGQPDLLPPAAIPRVVGLRGIDNAPALIARAMDDTGYARLRGEPAPWIGARVRTVSPLGGHVGRGDPGLRETDDDY